MWVPLLLDLDRRRGDGRGRDAGAGGEAVGATCPQTWKLWDFAPPPKLWTVVVVHLYFCLFMHVNMGPFQRIVGQIRGDFSFG